jgi:hypothetical protein
VASFFLIYITNVAELVIATCGFQEFSTVITNPRLTEFELEGCFSIISGVHKELGPVEISFGLDGVFVFEEETHNSNVHA